MYDIIIIGKGPAGVSAALYAVRSGLSVCIIAKDYGALEKAESIENYYGLQTAVPGIELAENGAAHAQSLGVEFRDGEVVSVEYDGMFTVRTAADELRAWSVIVACGRARRAPKIPGIEALSGHGVSYCAVCDGFFFRGKNVAVLGAGEYAASEAAVLRELAASVSVLTNGERAAAELGSYTVDERPLAAAVGDGRLEKVAFADGGELAVDGLFIALGSAGSSDLARKIGAVVINGNIAVDENMATNVAGFFAAGDCTGGLLQVVKAAADGAVAATSAISYVRAAKKNESGGK